MAKRSMGVLVKKTGKGLHAVRRQAVPLSKKAVKATHRHVVKPTARGVKHAARQAKRGSKVAHHHLAVRPHNYLQAKQGRYNKWHEWRFHHHVHYSTLAVFTALVLLFLGINIRNVLAASDLNDTWDFTTSGGYTIDAGIETSGSVARLKAQNYTSDANTMALYHLDESSGSTAADSSSNANNATSTDSPTFGTGKLNNAATFDGAKDQLKVADSASLSFNFANSLEAWTKFDTSFGNNTHGSRQSILDKGSYSLYYDNTNGRVTYEMAGIGSQTWSKVAGDDLNNSWNLGHVSVCDQTNDGTNVYVALCSNGVRSGGEVWQWNGSVWTKIGGQGINGSWPASVWSVNSIKFANGKLYAGTGDDNTLAFVYEWNGSSWTMIGGNNINSSWPANTTDSIMTLDYVNGKLYAGTGRSPNDARVYEWNGSTWTWVGGFGVTGYTAWPTGYDHVNALMNDGTNLYAGLGLSTGEADVWMLSGTTWTQVGGDGLNGSWAGSTYEIVHSMFYQGSTLYAGLGANAGDGELWAYTSGSWTKLGGDSLNSSWGSGIDYVRSISGDGTSIYVGLGDNESEDVVWRLTSGTWTQISTSGTSYDVSGVNSRVTSLMHFGGTLYAGFWGNGADLWTWNGTSWTQLGGDGVRNSWGMNNLQSIQSSITYKDKLYAGTGHTISGNGTVWEYDGATWSIVGGQGVRNSWSADTIESVQSMAVFKGELYVGLGVNANDADVWKYNGSTWTQVGGDSLNGSWGVNFEAVFSMAVYNNELYAGLGASGGDGKIWKYDGSTWTQVAGTGTAGNWSTLIEIIQSMTVYKGELYVGLGANATDSEVWKYDGSTWTQVGGDSLNGSWADTTYERVASFAVYNNELYAGLGDGTSDGLLWKYNGSTWTQVGGGGVNSSWVSTTPIISTMTVYNSELYVGLGNNNGLADVWKYNGSTWTQVGGDALNSGWSSEVEHIRSLSVYAGKLYVGTGDGAGDADMWSWGNNAVLASAATTQDTNWHHIAASYDGTNMKIFIDGVQNAIAPASNLMPDTNTPLLIGNGMGTSATGTGDSNFKGSIDEVRISNTARSGFTSKPYLQTAQTITLNNPVHTTGVMSWDDFTTVETPNGGTVKYRLSNDNGASWLYWSGSAWATSASLTDANDATTIDAHFATFPITFSGLRWQAVLQGNGDQQVQLGSITTAATSDSLDPSTPGSITALKSNGGSSLGSNGWTNGGSPYFSWTPSTDADAGVKGYCLYLGTDNTADPVASKGLLGTSPTNPGGCQFVVTTANIDLATSGYIATALTTSNSPYYVTVKAIDNAGNISDASSQFQFRFDNTPPTNPAFINAPGGFVTEKTVTLTWPTAGGSAAADANSAVAGLQYKINSGSWYGDSHSGTGDANDLLSNDGSYTTVDPPDFTDLVDGVNTVYFRTWDQAGNISTSQVVAAVRINTSGAPSEPLNVDVNPNTNTVNAFAFDWDEPADFIGEASNITYCYTVNTLPSAGTCTFTSPGVTALGAGPYANQPGVNTFYVAAKDESGNINYATYASTTFSANTPSPGIPTSVDVVDVSIKATSNWRLALTWDVPTNVGAGISSYRIFRSTNNATFTQVGSSASSTFIDSGLTQQRYYYKIKACDSTNNCGADSSVVDDIPTGRFTTPANIVAQPEVSSVTTKRAKISWSTDRESDSRIALGTTSGEYSSSEVAVSAQVTDHQVELDNLSAGTTYYYVAKWTDEDGNTAQSQEQTFTTSPAPSLKEVITLRTTLSSAVVQFTTRQAVKASIYYGQTEAFGGVQTINTSFAESTYTVDLSGLEDGTKYFYKIVTYDNEGTAYEGSIYSFTTPAAPRIFNLRFQPVEGEPTSTQKVTWQTNVASNSSIRFGKLTTTGEEMLDSAMVTDHEITIRGLEDDSEYFVVAQSRDANGNLATSDQAVFKTVLDTRPPKIYDVTIESSIRGTGAEARGQVVVSWKTDELATSQVAYGEGSNIKTYNNRTSEDAELATEHIVIVSDLPPSRVYSLQPISADKSGNSANGDNKTAIIGRASDGVMTIVINTLRRIFGY